jgi:MoaA/NifB/PqqE/SkfB family radical SAM enzyme
MESLPLKLATPDYGPRRLTVELTNICNLHCSYCLRDEDSLYHQPANFLPIDLFSRVIKDARASMGIEQVMFTGGEPTLHPDFGKIVAAVAAENLKCSFVTNGWHFDRIWPLILEHRQTITHVSFSLDGATADAHDRWRGAGSFARLVRAFSRCWARQVPFNAKVGIRRDTVPQLEQITLFVARLGAAGISFAHLMPTSTELAEFSALTLEERTEAEREIALLRQIFKLRISIDVGYYNPYPVAPCSALAGISGNLNYRGQLSLCCNLSGFRGASGEADVVADLNHEAFPIALARLQDVASNQAENRVRMLEELAAADSKADLNNGSPCLFCLNSFGKTPWSAVSSVTNERSLPVIQSR